MGRERKRERKRGRERKKRKRGREKKKEREREKERGRERGRGREKKKEGEGERCRICPDFLILFLKGMTGALAPFSYLVQNNGLICSTHNKCHSAKMPF